MNAISVSISSSVLKNSIFLSDPQPTKVLTQIVDTLDNIEKESWDQMQSQFADVTSAVFDELEELSEQIILKESGSMKRSAQEFSRKLLNQNNGIYSTWRKPWRQLLTNVSRFWLHQCSIWSEPDQIIFNSNSDQEKGLQPCVI